MEWRKDFWIFADYCDLQLGERPEGYTIDRIDNNRGYEPGNIRWASRQEQSRNTSTNLRIFLDGVDRNFWDVVLERNIPEDVAMLMRQRIGRGWSWQEALERPFRAKRRQSPKRVRVRVERDRVFTVEQVADIERSGLTVGLVKERIARGWPLQKAMTLPKDSVLGWKSRCAYCGEEGHRASAHPDYEEWLEEQRVKLEKRWEEEWDPGRKLK